ncbi:MAG: endo-1,4-beta-xylanase [Opitutaceae bacterium]|nr:endo-1,4-beta-xylanase [Opitutaceae bacterium]
MKRLILVSLALAGWVSAVSAAARTDAASVQALLAQAERNVEQYRKGDIQIHVVDSAGRPLAGVTVAVDQRSHHFRFGSIVFELTQEKHFTPEQAALFKERFSRLFNLAIVPFYWDGYEPVPGRTAWAGNLEVAKWCREQGITAKGHPLAWTHVAGMPAWLHELPPEYGKPLLQSRIVDTVKGFAGTIDLWDVANEAANTVSWDRAMKMRERVEGERYDNEDLSVEAVADWVDPCYRWAHAANPQATLLLNDFGQIAWPPVREHFFALVKELQRRGTPLHGIGLQAHEPRTEWFHPQKVWDTLERYRELGLPIHFTEFHPHSLGAPISGGYKEGTWTEENQAEFARIMYTLAFGHPSVASFTWWDFTENDSFIKGSALLNKDFSPKPAYRVLDELINHHWKTHTRMTTDTEGRIVLRGFYGEYQVRPESDNGGLATFLHTPGTASDWTIRVAAASARP